MSYVGSISDDPLAVARIVIITDPGLCHYRDLNTLHHMLCVGHTIPMQRKLINIAKLAI